LKLAAWADQAALDRAFRGVDEAGPGSAREPSAFLDRQASLAYWLPSPPGKDAAQKFVRPLFEGLTSS